LQLWAIAPPQQPDVAMAADNVTVGQPQLVFSTVEAFPTAMNSEAPVFVLYSDGTTIFREESPDKDNVYNFKFAKLSSVERKQLISSLASLKNVDGSYSISRITCQPTNILAVHTDQWQKRVKVIGRVSRPFDPNDPGERKSLPPQLNSAIDRLVHFKHQSAQPWMPEYISLTLTPYDQSKEDPAKWPSAWPDLNDERTQKVGTDQYTVLLPSSKFEALQAFMKAKPPRAAVLINGKQFLIRYRLPFPEEKSIATLKG
jgi:hypothetical protein